MVTQCILGDEVLGAEWLGDFWPHPESCSDYRSQFSPVVVERCSNYHTNGDRVLLREIP